MKLACLTQNELDFKELDLGFSTEFIRNITLILQIVILMVQNCCCYTGIWENCLLCLGIQNAVTCLTAWTCHSVGRAKNWSTVFGSRDHCFKLHWSLDIFSAIWSMCTSLLELIFQSLSLMVYITPARSINVLVINYYSTSAEDDW